MTNSDVLLPHEGNQAASTAVSKKYTVRILTQWLPALGIIGSMLYYAAFLYQHALNIPYADDIRDILLFLTEVSQSQDWTHSFGLFFAQINDHRTLSSRIVYYLVYLLTGEVNFRTLVFVGNLGLPLLLLMLYVPIRQKPNALLMLLPAALVLFQLRLFGTSFWSMNAFAFLFVFVYGFASLICLRKLNPARFLGAILFAALATFTLASGQLIWLVGIACVAHQVFVVRRAPVTYLLAWVLAACAVLAIYRIDYESAISLDQLLGVLQDEPLNLVLFFLVSLGRAFTDNNVALAVGSGVVLLIAVVWSSMRRWRGDDISLDLFAWYIILSLFAVAIARISAISWSQATGALPANISISDAAMFMVFSARYALFSVLLLATTVVLLLSTLHGGRALAINIIIVLLAFVYCALSYRVSLVGLQEQLYIMVGGHNSKSYWAFGDTNNESNLIVSNAEALGIYRPPARPLPIPNLTGSTHTKALRPSSAKQHKPKKAQ
jgi:hypothetical protein